MSVSQSVEQEKQNNPAKRTVTNARLAVARVMEHENMNYGLRFPKYGPSRVRSIVTTTQFWTRPKLCHCSNLTKRQRMYALARLVFGFPSLLRHCMPADCARLTGLDLRCHHRFTASPPRRSRHWWFVSDRAASVRQLASTASQGARNGLIGRPHWSIWATGYRYTTTCLAHRPK